MEDAITPNPQNVGIETDVVNDIRQTAADMSGWLKFLGIVNIIYGALTAISIVGIIIAWIPIWMGILLFQAGSSATNARFGANYELVTMMRKMKTFFILTAVLIIVSVAVVLIAFFTVGLGILPFLSSFSEFQQ